MADAALCLAPIGPALSDGEPSHASPELDGFGVVQAVELEPALAARHIIVVNECAAAHLAVGPRGADGAAALRRGLHTV